MSNAPTIWHCEPFKNLTKEDLYNILQFRNEVFVVEQDCVYQDCDSKDVHAHHLFAKHEDAIVAYTRLLPMGYSFPDATSIGRVLVRKSYRGFGLGAELMKISIQKTRELFGEYPIKIAAQVYLFDFYSSLGFKAAGSPFLEDGIPHIHMLLRF